MAPIPSVFRKILPVETSGKKIREREESAGGYLFLWVPFCEFNSMPFSGSLWFFQGFLLYLTLSFQIPVTTASFIHYGIAMVTVRLLPALGDSPVYCGSPITLPL